MTTDPLRPQNDNAIGRLTLPLGCHQLFALLNRIDAEGHPYCFTREHDKARLRLQVDGSDTDVVIDLSITGNWTASASADIF